VTGRSEVQIVGAQLGLSYLVELPVSVSVAA
jgi:hypothetical protein